jgi:hypothetical protein
MMPTPKDAALWMQSQVNSKGELYQVDAMDYIRLHFGSQFVTINASGNEGIAKSVLAAFNKLTAADVVWARNSRYWRRRQPGDEPGRQQDE